MNILSLFDGISCGRVALDRAKIPVTNYFASEIDKYAIQVSNKNYPNIIQLGDICSINIADLPKIDIILAGSPCQGFSVSGYGGGFEDSRSSLFFEFLNLLKKISPKYFLLENVKMKREWSDKISNLIGVDPILLNSDLVSGQRRERLYWTNIPYSDPPENKYIFLRDCIDSPGWVDRDKAYCIDANYFKGTSIDFYCRRKRRQLVWLDKEKTKFRKLTPLECERLQTLPTEYTQGISSSQRYKCIGNGWTVDIISHLLSPIQV